MATSATAADYVKLAGFLGVFAAALLATPFFVPGFDHFQGFMICVALVAFAGFQVAFYAIIESNMPKNVALETGRFFMKMYPQAKASLLESNRVTEEQLQQTKTNLRAQNIHTALSSVMFAFLVGVLGVGFLSLLVFMRPFTVNARFPGMAQGAGLAGWLTIFLVHLIVFVFVVRQHTYVEKSELAEFSVNTLRKLLLDHTVKAAATNGLPAAENDATAGAIKRIILESYKIDLSDSVEPPASARFKSVYNGTAVALACVALLVLAYSMIRLVTTGHIGNTVTIVLFIPLLSYYYMLFLDVPRLRFDTTLEHPDAFIYEMIKP